MKILVTGGAGFIGSNFIRYWLKKYPADTITNLDLMTYAGDPGTIPEFKKKGVKFIKGDICDRKVVDKAMKGQDVVFHLAAESHVDRSILGPQIFLQTNILGTQTLLEAARVHKPKRFVYISTDEVYGSIEKGHFTEKHPIEPNSPYSVSKAGSDLLVRAYFVTYNLPVITTRCCNNYGPYHFPEKVIPLFITNLMEGKKVPVYGKGANVREWIYVTDHASAIDTAFRKGTPGEVYNAGSGYELSNIELARKMVKAFGFGDEMIDFVTDRPGHDLRYAIDSSKLRGLGWKPEYEDFEKGLAETIEWYKKNTAWWRKIKSKSTFKSYHKVQYKK